jgi:hypothetical protein
MRPITLCGGQRRTCRRTQSSSTSSYVKTRTETYGIPLRALIGAPFLFISLTMLALHRVSLTVRVGIGSEQARHDSCIRSAIDCDDELALIGMMKIPSWIPPPLTTRSFSLIYWISCARRPTLYCMVSTVGSGSCGALFVGRSGDSAHNNVL